MGSVNKFKLSAAFPPAQNFILPLILIFSVTFNSNKVFVSGARSSASSATSDSSSSSSGGTSGGGNAGGDTIATSASSSVSHRERANRELISAQFRAAHDARDLDTGDPTRDLEDPLAIAAAAGGVLPEEEQLAMSKYMAASASAYVPSKLRLNRYTQAGFYDPYPSYTAALTSVPSSYYPYNAYSAYRENPMIDTYPYYERDRIREIQTRAMQASSSSSLPQQQSYSSTSSNRDGFGGGGSGYFNGMGAGGFREGFRSNDPPPQHDSLAMSSSHGGDDHGGGHGWQHSHVNHYTSKVNTNAIGLLGLLGLLSLLSNVLLQFTTTTTTTTTAAAGRRKKRSVADNMRDEDGQRETHEQRRERIFMEVLPHLTPVAHARDGTIPVECTFRGVCMANKVLVTELGAHGRPAGVRISSAIVKLLDKVIPPSSKGKSKGKMKSKLKKKLESAGLQGRNAEDCEKEYPVCNALKHESTSPSLPFIIKMQDLPQLISKVSKLTQGTGGGFGFGVPMNL